MSHPVGLSGVTGAGMPKHWTTHEVARLRAFYTIMPARQCERFIPGRSMEAIRTRAKRMGIQSLHDVNPPTIDLEEIKDDILDGMTITQMAEKHGFHRKTIGKHIKTLHKTYRDRARTNWRKRENRLA